MDGVDPFNLSDAEFEAVMRSIDAHVRQRREVIPGRELLALLEFTKRFHIELPMGHPLETRIVAWFKAVYGTRLNTDLNRGYCAVLVRGDVYKLRFLTLIGGALVVSSPEWLGQRMVGREPTGNI